MGAAVTKKFGLPGTNGPERRDHDQSPLGPHARVDHDEVDRAVRERVDHCREDERAFEDVLRGDGVRDVDELGAGARPRMTPFIAATYEPS